MNTKAKQLPDNVSPANDPATLLTLAVEKNVDVDQLEKLMGLYERWQEREAEKAFNRDLNEFKAKCPAIKKTKEVKRKNGELLYKYAPLDEIVETVRPILKDLGFSFDFDTQRTEDGGLNVTCYLRHREGFTRKSTFPVPAIQGSLTNAAQDEGSKTTFGRRYALQNVLGIAPEDDDDGISAQPENMVFLIKHNEIVRENLFPILNVKDHLAENDLDSAAEIIAEMDRPTFEALWRAPKFGGMWTTEERAKMKDKEFADRVHLIRKDSGWYEHPENQT